METKVPIDGVIRGLLPVGIVGLLGLAAASFFMPPMSGPFAEPTAKLLAHPILFLVSSGMMGWLLLMMGLPTLRELLASLVGGIVGGAVLLGVVALQPGDLILTLLIALIIAPSVGTLAYGLAYRVGLKSTSL